MIQDNTSIYTIIYYFILLLDAGQGEGGNQHGKHPPGQFSLSPGDGK
jgi:hypothetical protein